MKKIGDILHKEFKTETPVEKLPAVQVPEVVPLATEDGVVRCRFDLFVRYPEDSTRRKKAFTYRGDFFEKDPDKMLWNLVRMIKNKYHEFLLAELYDNTMPRDDPGRLILRYKNKQILINRLPAYGEMLKDCPLPEWLKGSV